MSKPFIVDFTKMAINSMWSTGQIRRCPACGKKGLEQLHLSTNSKKYIHKTFIYPGTDQFDEYCGRDS